MNKLNCVRWVVDLSTWQPTIRQITKAVAAVQPEERLRLMKYHFLDDVLLSLVGRLMMRKFVAQNTGIGFNEVCLKRDERNKPYWVNNSAAADCQLSFSTSHQSSLVVLAGVSAQSKNCDFGVGIDIMKVEYSGGRKLSEFFRLMQRTFTASEWQYIKRAAFNESQQLKAFMRHWTLKEAYTKEIGVGITMNLQYLSFSIDSSDEEPSENRLPIISTKLHIKEKLVDNYIFEEHLLCHNYCVSIAFRDVQPSMDKFVYLDIDELLVDSDLAQQTDMQEYGEKLLLKERKKLGI